VISGRPNKVNALKTKLERAAIAPSTIVTARCEIYESDAKTLWNPDGNPFSRLIDGSIAVNGNADDSRRTGDITLENQDGVLDSFPGGFWYDKIIKLYRGMQLPLAQPKIIIIQDASNLRAAFKAMLQSWGYTDITINLAARTLAVLQNYDVIVALGGNSTIDSVNVTPLLTVCSWHGHLH
jgi:hypothetical protein